MRNKFLITILSCVSVIVLFYIFLAAQNGRALHSFPTNSAELVAYANNHYYREGRKTRTIEINNLWLARIPAAQKVEEVYIGSSRSKFLRPHIFLNHNSLVLGGNSYNEISYGLLLQAETVRERFPTAKTFYFEASLLLRRPLRLAAESDHLKYLELFNQIKPEVQKFYPAHEIEDFLNQQKHLANPFGLNWMRELARFKASSLITKYSKDATLDQYVKGEVGSLSTFGEYEIPVAILSEEKSRPGEVNVQNAKVQRIAESAQRIPGDNLFEVIALWGQRHEIEVVFYEPPVRSDLLKFKSQYGHEAHKEDLRRLAEKYNLKYIDMNHAENGISNLWDYFSDEDHVNTCAGSFLITSGLQTARKMMQERNLHFLNFNFSSMIKQKVWVAACSK